MSNSNFTSASRSARSATTCRLCAADGEHRGAAAREQAVRDALAQQAPETARGARAGDDEVEAARLCERGERGRRAAVEEPGGDRDGCGDLVARGGELALHVALEV